jgi:hypothetical protein
VLQFRYFYKIFMHRDLFVGCREGLDEPEVFNGISSVNRALQGFLFLEDGGDPVLQQIGGDGGQVNLSTDDAKLEPLEQRILTVVNMYGGNTGWTESGPADYKNTRGI